MSSVQGFAASLYNLALESGLQNGPLVYQVRAGTDKYVVVSNVEPTELVLPLNILWVHLENGTPTLLRRVSKEAGSGTLHTWAPETNYDAIFTTENVWAPEDQVVRSANLVEGGQLTGPLYPVAKDVYEETEVPPVSWVRKFVNGVRNSLMSMYQNMNNRVLYDDQRIRALTLRTEETVARVQALEGSASNNQHLHSQEMESGVWVVDHGFGPDMIVTIFVTDSNGDNIWPDRVQREVDTHVVYFSLALSGYALAIGMKP